MRYAIITDIGKECSTYFNANQDGTVLKTIQSKIKLFRGYRDMSSDLKEYIYQELSKITDRDNLEIYLVKNIKPESVFMLFEHENHERPAFVIDIRDYSNFGWIYKGGYLHFEKDPEKLEKVIKVLFKMDISKAWKH